MATLFQNIVYWIANFVKNSRNIFNALFCQTAIFPNFSTGVNSTQKFKEIKDFQCIIFLMPKL